MNTQSNSNAGSGCPATTCSDSSSAVMQKCCECGISVGMQSMWTNDKGPICQLCWAAQYPSKAATEADYLRDTMAKMEHNHRYEREKMSRVIRRLVRYADRVAERHPKAVTICGQNARVEGGIWLAEFDRQNAIGEARAECATPTHNQTL